MKSGAPERNHWLGDLHGMESAAVVALDNIKPTEATLDAMRLAVAVEAL